MTGPQIQDVIEHYTKENKKTPTAKQLMELGEGGITKGQATAALARYKREMKKIFVIDGKLYMDGETVWCQSSAGSLMPGRFREDKTLGKFVTP